MTTARIEVPFWPTGTDNLSWSADNLIAVGGSDSVAILVPRLNRKGPNNLSWDSVVFRVNGFSLKEIPFKDPFSSANWSLGEELSLRYVESLKWSPPGLARFGTCVLAILHSNQALALWECFGQPQSKDKWRRCLTVNRAVQAYYRNSSTPDKETRQVRQRIRAFAWAPALRKKRSSIDSKLSAYLAPSINYLAVSTDGGDILILKVESPHHVLATENVKWSCNVVHRIRLHATNGNPQSGILQNSGVSPISSVTALAFSAWSGRTRSRLAYIAQSRLYVCDVHYEDSADLSSRLTTTDPIELASPLASELSRPLQFAPNSDSLLLFGPDTVLNVDTAAFPTGKPRNHHLDGRWDAITGLAFVANANGSGNANTDLHIVSHLSTASSATSRLPKSLSKVANFKEPNWQNALQEDIANYAASNDLGSSVQERTWGIASSPLGDFVATCVSLLPSDIPAHIIQSEQRSIVAITQEYSSEEIPLPSGGGQSLPETISAETLLYCFHQYATRDGSIDTTKNNTESIVQSAMRALDISEEDLNVVTEMPLPLDGEDVNDDELDSKLVDYLIYLRAQIFYGPNMLSQRIERLKDVAFQQKPKLQLAKESLSHIADVIIGLPNRFKEASDLSSKIGTAFAAVKTKIDSLGSSVDPEMMDSVHFIEQCGICDQNIKFENPRWSRCAGGHQFTRCALTFLSIMEPGISKSCRICNALYINEDTLPAINGTPSEIVKSEDETMVDGEAIGGSGAAMTEDGQQQQRTNVIEPQVSLARLLFAACDKCILCGGKFVA